MRLYGWSSKRLGITVFCVVVHNSTYVRFTDPFMLSDPWNPMEISWDTLKLVRKCYKESMQVTNQGSTNTFVIVWLLEAGHTHVKHWWWKNSRCVVAKMEYQEITTAAFSSKRKGCSDLMFSIRGKRKMQQNYVFFLTQMQVRNVTAVIVPTILLY